MKKLLCAAAVFGLIFGAYAETGVSLTVYNDNLALVRDVRTMQFSEGTGEILFADVASQIDQTSVHFQAPGVALLEQNYDFDLVSPEKILKKYVDKQIEIVTEQGDVVGGTLLNSGGAYAGGQIILQQRDGSLRSMLLEQAMEIRYPELPEGLITRPTLRWLVNSSSGGEKETEVSYLTSGLSWRTDYVLVLAEKEDAAGLDAWVTLNNTSGASYHDAKLKLIAGEIHRAEAPGRGAVKRNIYATEAMDLAAPQFEERTFFEYHLYTLQRPTSVLDQQTKQVSLFPGVELDTRRVYEYDYRRKDNRIGVSIEFENRQENQLGIPLPAGRVRVFQKDRDNSQEFIGEDNIEHTPKDEKVRVRVGEAFDLAVERVQKDYRQISRRVSETDYEVKIRNHKEEAVEVLVLDYFWGDWEVTSGSHPHTKVSSSKVEFKVPVEPDEEAVLTYTVRNSW